MRWIYSLALAAVLLWGLEQVAVSPLETGEVYPPYSSLRSDPLGSKALYESLAALPGIEVEREYKERRPLAANETLLVLGVDPASFSDLQPAELEGYEKLVAGGGRLVIAFLQVGRRVDRPQKRAIVERWHLEMKYQPGIGRDQDSTIPRETALFFEAGEGWRQIDGHNAVERDFGRGSIVLVADSFPLSNQGLREARDAAFLAGLMGPAKTILFDENHFGIEETGSVTTLLRRYHLEAAVGVLALAAILFLWRSASSLLPARRRNEAEAVAGRDAIDGMTALLIRGIAEKNLLSACLAEWNRSNPREKQAAAVEDRIMSIADPVEAYRAACGVFTGKMK